jgi:saccharopine dehydrogenase-like NADP-dependent oxidoreductase
LIKGTKDGQERELLIYNVADHEDAYAETDSQGISYTAGVPPVAAARLIVSGEWDAKRMVNVEELPAAPFLTLLDQMGLPTRIKDANGDRPWDQLA